MFFFGHYLIFCQHKSIHYLLQILHIHSLTKLYVRVSHKKRHISFENQYSLKIETQQLAYKHAKTKKINNSEDSRLL